MPSKRLDEASHDRMSEAERSRGFAVHSWRETQRDSRERVELGCGRARERHVVACLLEFGRFGSGERIERRVSCISFTKQQKAFVRARVVLATR